MRGDGAHDDGVDVARLELGQRDARMAGLEVGMALVVHVVQQPDDAPQLLVLAAARARRRASPPPRPGNGGAGTPIATHSERRSQASSRESCTDMAVRLAEPPIPPPGAAPPHVMEKFVIDGGVPLRGTVTPAGNKNARAADPGRLGPDDGRGPRAQRAAHPRRRGDARRAARPRRDGRVARRQRGRDLRGGRRPRGAGRPRARRAHPRLVPARRPAARALRPRRHAAARRRRHRPPAPGPAPRRLPRAGRDATSTAATSSSSRPAAACAPARSSWTSRR